MAEISGMATSVNDEQKPVALPDVVRCNCAKERLLHASLSTNVAEKSPEGLHSAEKGVWTRRWNRLASHLFRIRLKIPRFGIVGGGKKETRQEPRIKGKKRKRTQKHGCLQFRWRVGRADGIWRHLFNMSGPMWVASP